jgi:hypothetical protein
VILLSVLFLLQHSSGNWLRCICWTVLLIPGDFIGCVHCLSHRERSDRQALVFRNNMYEVDAEYLENHDNDDYNDYEYSPNEHDDDDPVHVMEEEEYEEGALSVANSDNEGKVMITNQGIVDDMMHKSNEDKIVKPQEWMGKVEL